MPTPHYGQAFGLSLHLTGRGKLRGQAGPGIQRGNRFIGSYQLDGKRLGFIQMAGTRMACVEGMEQEEAFLKALESTASWEITGEHLELYDAGGGMLLRFEAR